jgi:hypothetical protein
MQKTSERRHRRASPNPLRHGAAQLRVRGLRRGQDEAHTSPVG